MPWYPMLQRGGVAMPYIKARITYGEQRHRREFLVDTGAAISMAPISFAAVLVGDEIYDESEWPRERLPIRIKSVSGEIVERGLSLTVTITPRDLEPVQEKLWFIEGWSHYLLGHQRWFERRGAAFPVEAKLPRQLRGQGRHFALYT